MGMAVESVSANRSRPFVKAEELSLAEWLKYVAVPDRKRKVEVRDYCFPTDAHREEYLSGVQGRSESEVRSLLRNFLPPSGSLGTDSSILNFLLAGKRGRLLDVMERDEFVRRMLLRQRPWEGITWILDLVPDNARKALDVLDAYFAAHAQYLPDGRAHGLADAEAVIRYRYFRQDNPREALLSLRPTEFEFLIAALFDAIGYDVSTTQASFDGGIDVIARNTETGRAEFLLIQCKRYAANVPVSAVRELMGVVSQMQANKGLLISTSDFTRQARKEALSTSRIEVLNFSELNLLMNEHFGPRWPTRMTYQIRDMQRRLTERQQSKTSPAAVR